VRICVRDSVWNICTAMVGFLRDRKLLSIVSDHYCEICIRVCVVFVRTCDFRHVDCAVALLTFFLLVMCITMGLDKYTRWSNNNCPFLIHRNSQCKKNIISTFNLISFLNIRLKTVSVYCEGFHLCGVLKNEQFLLVHSWW